MSLPSFGDLYEQFEGLVEDAYFTGRYLLKSKTVSEESGVTWKAKVHDDGEENILGKIAFAFSGEVPDVLQCDVKSSLRTDGRVRSKVSLGELTVIPNASLEISAEVNTTAPKAEDNVEIGAQYGTPYYTVNGAAKFPGAPDGEREVGISAVVGLNGLMAGCNIVMGGEQEYGVAYQPGEEWGITALCKYTGESFGEAKVAYVHQVQEGCTVGGEYSRNSDGTSNVTLAIEKACEETGFVVKGKADTSGMLSGLVRQRVAPGLYLGTSVLREERGGNAKISLSVLFERP
jgi:hypothetical protein